jgi:hypothetical protein
MILDAPKDINWPAKINFDFFSDIYDWDRLVLDSESENLLSDRLVLCTGPLPCVFSMLGVGLHSSVLQVQRENNGSLACLSKFGCSALHITKVQLVCASLSIFSAGISPLEIGGASLTMENSSTFNCRAEKDGGSIRAYEGAIIQVRS